MNEKLLYESASLSPSLSTASNIDIEDIAARWNLSARAVPLLEQQFHLEQVYDRDNDLLGFFHPLKTVSFVLFPLS